MRPEDLAETARLLELHGQAVARGMITGSEADRLRFVASAEHAMAIGRTNPAGLFAHLIRKGRWRYLTQGDEVRASARLKAHDRRSSSEKSPAGEYRSPALGSAGPVAPSDAEVVRSIRRATIAAGIYRDPYPEFARQNPGWTRERWDAAMSAMGGGRVGDPDPPRRVGDPDGGSGRSGPPSIVGAGPRAAGSP